MLSVRVRVCQVQTRSADEPMTTFVVCNNCGNRWKVSDSSSLRWMFAAVHSLAARGEQRGANRVPASYGLHGFSVKTFFLLRVSLKKCFEYLKNL